MRLMRLIALILLLCFAVFSTATAQEGTEEPDTVATEPAEAGGEEESTEEAGDDGVEQEDAEDDTDSDDDEVEDTEDDTDTDEPTVYIVQPGDTLFRIAVRFRTTTIRLASANGIVNPSLILVGQRIVIPDTETVTPPPPVTPEPPPPAATSYIVQPGDTLFRIAIANGTTVPTLLRLNPNIANANIIFVGQRIVLPGGAETPEVTETPPEETETPNEPIESAEFGTGIEVFLGDDIDSIASQTIQLGVGWAKVRVNWADVQPEADQFDWDFLDETVAVFDDLDFNILLTLTGSPDWARPSATDLARQQPTYGPPDDLNDFGSFVAAVAERYSGVVDGYEIWEQPNNRLTWMKANVTMRSDGFPDVGLSSTRYIDLLEAAYDGIKSVDADAAVVTAGLAPTGNNDFYNSIDNFVFFEDLLRQGGLRYADAVGIHVDGFSNAPDAACCGEAGQEPPYDESYHFFFSNTIENYRDILNRRGGEETVLWVTRFGWGTSDTAIGEPTSGQGFINLNTPEEQAQFTTIAFQWASERGDIGPMILYNLNGCNVGLREACFYSVINAEGAARPVFNSVVVLDLTSDPE